MKATELLRPDLMDYAVEYGGISRLDASRMTIPALQQAVQETLDAGGPVPSRRGKSPASPPPPPAVTPEPEPAAPVPPPPPAASDVPEWAKGMIEAVKSAVKPDIDKALELAKNANNGSLPRAVEVTVKPIDRPAVKLDGPAHKTMPKLISRTLATRWTGTIPTLVGPAGSGKTHAGKQLAGALTAALGLDTPLTAYAMSFHAGSQPHDLLGYQDANGNYRDTEFYRAWSGGGVIVIDEADTSRDVLVALNAPLANGVCQFPGIGSVERHEHCYIVAGANTYGRGATAEYTGRDSIDRASLNRFVMIDWGYDEGLEMAIAGKTDAGRNWVLRVQALRAAAAMFSETGHTLGILISPRASIAGAAILDYASDTPWTELEDELIWQGCDAEVRERVTAAVK